MVGDLAKIGVFVPMDGHEPVVLDEKKLREARESVASDALSVFEKLVGLGAFGVHEPLTYEEQDQLRVKMDEKREIAAKADEAYKGLVAAEMARARVLEEKAARIYTGDRLVFGEAIFDEPDTIASVWGVGKFVLRAKGQGTMIASQQGLGKTTIAQQVVLHRIGVRSGDFLGYPVEPVGDGEMVLYLAADRPTQAMGSLRRMVTKDDETAEKLKSRLAIWKGPLPFNVVLEPEAFAAWLDELSEKHERKIVDVVVDSVKDMAGGSSLSKDDVGGALNLAWQEAMARGVDLLLLHHQRKASGGEARANTLDDVFGSTLLTSGLGSVFALSGESGGSVVELSHLKQPLEGVELRLNHDHQAGVTTVGRGEVGDVTVENLLMHAAGDGMTVKALAEAIHGQYSATTKKAIARELTALAKAGSAKKASGGMSSGGKTPDVWYFQGISSS